MRPRLLSGLMPLLYTMRDLSGPDSHDNQRMHHREDNA